MSMYSYLLLIIYTMETIWTPIIWINCHQCTLFFMSFVGVFAPFCFGHHVGVALRRLQVFIACRLLFFFRLSRSLTLARAKQIRMSQNLWKKKTISSVQIPNKSCDCDDQTFADALWNFWPAQSGARASFKITAQRRLYDCSACFFFK